MASIIQVVFFICALLVPGCYSKIPKTKGTQSPGGQEFPSELVRFKPYQGNPVFKGTGDSADWDEKIRERGFILKEGATYYLWYTGYTRSTGNTVKYLGLATSPDGLKWTRHSRNPIHKSIWIEDVFVLKSDTTYYMFAESRGDTAHLLTSVDKTVWRDQGALDIRLTNGKPIGKGAFGTPAVWKEQETWYLFYERNDAAVWLASSKDLKVWVNVRDEPILRCGPERYDRFAVAINQIILHKGQYYAYYHASAFEDWREWTTNIAVSRDLVHWEKYDGNPILRGNKSSGMVVKDGGGFRLYTMHPEVNMYLN